MAVILALCAALLAGLALETRLTRRARRRLLHVVQVNGTRGKTAVSRLIAAGLRGGGINAVCKTTGTLPMWVDREARLLRRLGAPSIREQAMAVRRAAREGAKALVAECMAVNPDYQAISQQMLGADVAVITNVRPDHFEEMGRTLPEIALSLCRMLPKGGVVVTAEEAQLPVILREADKAGCRVIRARPAPGEELPGVDFAENEALALAVCQLLGVPREAALSGMREGYLPDPFAYWEGALGAHVFASAFSANDPLSTRMLAERALESQKGAKLVLLIANRADRPQRARQCARLAVELAPCQVWFYGAYSRPLAGYLKRRGVCARVARVGDFIRDAEALESPSLLFGMGNVKGAGRALTERAKMG